MSNHSIKPFVRIYKKVLDNPTNDPKFKLINASYMPCKLEITTNGNYTINGDTSYSGEVFGGEVGIILDGRGRPFNFNFKSKNRISLVENWRKSINEYPGLEI